MPAEELLLDALLEALLDDDDDELPPGGALDELDCDPLLEELDCDPLLEELDRLAELHATELLEAADEEESDCVGSACAVGRALSEDAPQETVMIAIASMQAERARMRCMVSPPPW